MFNSIQNEFTDFFAIQVLSHVMRKRKSFHTRHKKEDQSSHPHCPASQAEDPKESI